MSFRADARSGVHVPDGDNYMFGIASMERVRTACLEAGVLKGVLTYVDFFTQPVQRCAAKIVANLTIDLPTRFAHLLGDVVPLVANLLSSSDQQSLCCMDISLLIGNRFVEPCMTFHSR